MAMDEGRPAPERASTEQLVSAHLNLVRSIAGRVRQTISAAIEMDDLVGWGSRGLVEAADRFDPSRGVTFTTFAYYRIRGAMYDGLRSMGWYSRAEHARFRAAERENEYLRSHADREAGATSDGAPEAPGPATPAAAESLAGLLDGIAAIHIASLEAASDVGDDRLPPADQRLDAARLGARVREAVSGLPDKERRLMQAYYFEGKNLEEAGAELGLSKSWACRLHARAVDALRVRLADAA
jgi:RNA polymerase sigma factor for flagellar operon FliA